MLIELLAVCDFADDTIIFCDLKIDQIQKIQNVVDILRCYEVVLGLKVNLFKSALYANTTGHTVESFSTSYLRLPLSLVRISNTLWNSVM